MTAPLHRGLSARRKLVPLRAARGPRPTTRRIALGRAIGSAPRPLRPAPIASQAIGDSQQIRAGCALFAVALARLPRSEEYFLGQFLGLLGPTDQPKQIPPDRPAVQVDPLHHSGCLVGLLPGSCHRHTD